MDNERGGCAAVSAGREKTKVSMRLKCEAQAEYRNYHLQVIFTSLRVSEPILIYSADWWRLGCVSFVARARGRGRLRAGTILSLLANQIRKTAFFVRQVPPERDQHRHKWPFLVEVGNQEHAIYGNHCQC